MGMPQTMRPEEREKLEGMLARMQAMLKEAPPTIYSRRGYDVIHIMQATWDDRGDYSEIPCVDDHGLSMYIDVDRANDWESIPAAVERLMDPQRIPGGTVGFVVLRAED